jgi:hypothetical protein
VHARASRLTTELAASGPFRPALNVVISNVPGPSMPLYLAGARLCAHYPVSVVADGVGLNITVMSYRDDLDVGIVCDRDQMDDPWALVDGMRAALEEFCALDGAEPAERARRQAAGSTSRQPPSTQGGRRSAPGTGGAMPLSAVVLNCTLRPSPATSNAEALARVVIDALEQQDVACQLIRLVDHDVKRGVSSDEVRAPGSLLPRDRRAPRLGRSRSGGPAPPTSSPSPGRSRSGRSRRPRPRREARAGPAR